jgi:hypothetical protein
MKETTDIHVNNGMVSSITVHIDRINRVFRVNHINFAEHVDEIKSVLLGNKNTDLFIPDDKMICDLVIEHRGWLQYTLDKLKFYRGTPCNHKNSEVVTPSMFKLFSDYMDDVNVPIQLWTHRYFSHEMIRINTELLGLSLTDWQCTETRAKLQSAIYQDIRVCKIQLGIRKNAHDGKCYMCDRKRKAHKSILFLGVDVNICRKCFSNNSSISDTKSPTNKHLLSEKEMMEFCLGLNDSPLRSNPLTKEQADGVIDIFSRYINWRKDERI